MVLFELFKTVKLFQYLLVCEMEHLLTTHCLKRAEFGLTFSSQSQRFIGELIKEGAASILNRRPKANFRPSVNEENQ